ncbi:protein-export protein SecB [Aureimonas endophytica]|uniref:Protein-export protein SecB n=1 Tax=Aureimonas endophytica TaxID=2027858 RepID=A0A916ZP03_9HYPH|nr:protein-export chaperone SecB [Aureimonas endophytica]GGE07061.1 protein-export protein SecB [Aureimonas endophytica]
MSDANNQTNGASAEVSPTLNILAQYIKDFSFESPNAPNALRNAGRNPTINIGVNVSANPVDNEAGEFDVRLSLDAKAGEGADMMFHAELEYGGVFRLQHFPQEHLLPVLFIECPRLLFPFARQIVADVTRNAGFPPLMIDPIDFAQLFQQRMAEERARQQVGNA